MRLLVASCSFLASLDKTDMAKKSLLPLQSGDVFPDKASSPFPALPERILLLLPHASLFSLLHFVLQAKVAEELAAATAQVSQLQLELTAHQKKEMDLRKQLSCAVQDAERQEAQLSKLQAQVAGEAAPACPLRAPSWLFYMSQVFPVLWGTFLLSLGSVTGDGRGIWMH